MLDRELLEKTMTAMLLAMYTRLDPIFVYESVKDLLETAEGDSAAWYKFGRVMSLMALGSAIKSEEV
jgi:hypothetical protein